jgi:hypothetical protein
MSLEVALYGEDAYAQGNIGQDRYSSVPSEYS